MTAAIRPRIFQERRRLAFVSILAFLAGFLFYIHADLYVLGVHVAFITGAVYAGVVGSSALVICLVWPSMRFMIEAVAVSRLVFSGFVLAEPKIGYAVLASPLMTACVVVAGGICVSRVMHGRIERERRPGLRGRLLPGAMFRRLPARIRGTKWQQGFVAWLDGAAASRA